MCEKGCKQFIYACISVFIGIILGVAVVIFYLVDAINIELIMSAALWLAVASLAFLIVAGVLNALFKSNLLSMCLCRSNTRLLTGIIGTIIFMLLGIAIFLASTSIVGIIFAGLGTIFATQILFELACVTRCLLCHRNCCDI